MFKSKPWQMWFTALVGLWVINSPFLLSYPSSILRVSDITCGAALLLISGLSLHVRSVWPQWVIAGIGLWLCAAPLLFWAPKASMYISDSLAGIAVMTFAVILPYSVRTGGPDTRPDWSYNPSTWKQRFPIIIIGAVAYVGATYLAFYQLGYIKTVWDPFFGDGTRRVLESDVSKAFPVSDAGLGAFAYLLECLSGLVGDTRRWRTLPWMALLFWVLVVPAGVVSIVLVMLQPIAVEAWCALCLFTATLTLITVPPAMDEFILTAQFLLAGRREGKSLWKLFWQGDVEEGIPQDTPEDTALDLSLPWNLCVSVLLGLFLMAAPAWLGISGALANSHFMTGALVITFAVIGMAEVGRPFRLLNMLFGAWAILAPWIFSTPFSIRGIDALAGLLIIGLAWPSGVIKDRHGAWDSFVNNLFS